MMTEHETLWEAKVQGYAHLIDPWTNDEDFSTTYKLEFHEITIVKRTPKGYWLCHGDPNGLHTPPFWRKAEGRSQWRYAETKEGAVEGLKKRLRYRMKLYEAKARRMKQHLELVEREEGTWTSSPSQTPSSLLDLPGLVME
jgi:hypothetical protein